MHGKGRASAERTAPAAAGRQRAANAGHFSSNDVITKLSSSAREVRHALGLGKQPSPTRPTSTKTSVPAPAPRQVRTCSREYLRTALKPRQRQHLRNLAARARKNVSRRFEEGTRKSSFRFWRILVGTAILSSLLSYTIDQTTWVMGEMRTKFTTIENKSSLFWVIFFNVFVCFLGRFIVRTTVEAEGSGFPEVKAMLFGKVMLNFLTLRVMFVKAIVLALGVGGGMPLGKEGPNVHMAACISRFLGSDFYETKRGRNSVSGIHLLLAACAVGVGASFSAPIGGVVFSLELVMPQVFDYIGYSGCFLSAVTGSMCFCFYRTWTAGATGLLPLMSSNVLAGEGASSKYPAAALLLYIILGMLCGILGGLWIKLHAKVVGSLKRWRLRGDPAPAAKSIDEKKGALYDSLLGDSSAKKKSALRNMTSSCGSIFRKKYQCRDYFQIGVTVVVNTILAASLPLLRGRPQPALLSLLFNKDLLEQQETWVVPGLSMEMSMFLCFLMKWTTTIFALSMPYPAGVVAPTMIIGGLLGRCFGMCLPDALVDTLLTTASGELPDEGTRGAFMARLAIVGAAAFCSAVCRAFAMAITVFEVLGLPNAILPLCSASLAAMFVADKIALPYFDTNLVGRGLGGISALTHTKKAMEPAFHIMRRVSLEDCLEETLSLKKMRALLAKSDEDYFPVVQAMPEQWGDDKAQAVLKGKVARKDLEVFVRAYARSSPEQLVDLRDPNVLRPTIRTATPFVSCNPATVSPTTHVQDVYLLMKISHSTVVYVVQDNLLLGEIKWKELLGHKL